jgi:serine/threonine-protein kinase
MTVSVGTRLGPYEIVAPIGAGGMGEVYRARDTKLDRAVAIKILPESFAGDPDRLARFEREAKTLAALNHPNIGGIHGLEEANGVSALVLELVEGPTLADRIAQGAIPLDESLAIARQIADALEAAHEQGIIHRDLKPANIKLRPDGPVKVLDFGLAKALGQDGSGSVAPPLSLSPTITSPALMTGTGVILGTAAYMAPEQARGKPVDKRADLWAFGCVVYEMLTGRPAFEGAEVTDVLARVIEREADFARLPSSTPAAIRRLLRRCLEKDRRRRLADAADARLEIDEALTMPASETSAAPATGSQGGWRRGALVAAAALALGGAAAGSAVWTAIRPGPARVTRTVIQTSGPTALAIPPRGAGTLAITPDGSRVVYTAAGQLVVRRLDQFDPEALAGLGSPMQPFISPDGQWVGFFDGLAVKKVAIAGGPGVMVIQDISPGGGPLGATWGSDGTIVYAGSIGGGLKRVPAAGGDEAATLTTPDRARGEVRHAWPAFLPGGRALLFTIVYAGRGPRIAVLDLETGAKTELLSGVRARYLPSGHLVFGTEATLRAVAFDLERQSVVGAPVPVVAPVAANQGQFAYEYDVATDGTLVYLAASIESPATRTLVWLDRQGRETSLGMQAGPYIHPRLAPDGTRVAITNAANIWIWDLARARLTRGPLDSGTISIWTPDSARLIFSSFRGGGGANLYVQAADGTGTPTRLTDSPNTHHPTAVTSDGTQILFNEATPTRLGDIGLLTMSPTPQVKPLVATRFDERGGVVSPDGRWLAYESNRSGAYEVWVQPFPVVDAGLWQVSTAGGHRPLWARSGRELFYVAPDGALMAVQWEARGSVWSAGAQTRLLEGQYFRGSEGTTVRQYDVTADGQRLLMMKNEARASDAAPSISVVQHWTEELKRLVPAR